MLFSRKTLAVGFSLYLLLRRASAFTTAPMNLTTACPTACSLAGPYLNGFWAWIPQTAMNDIFPFTGATSTATLVTIIDVDRAHTTTSVQYPGNYTPAANSAGTRTQVVSYENDNSPPEWMTETVTYPSAFAAWPSTYIWYGYSSLDGPTPTCTSGRWTETVSGNPQPTDASEWTPLMAVAGNDFEDDPEGNSYVLGTVVIGYWQWATMSALWPDQPPLTTCIDSDIGPNWAAFTSTSWYTATSTKYTSTTSSPLPSSEDPSSTLNAAPTPPRVLTTSSRLPTAPASTDTKDRGTTSLSRAQDATRTITSTSPAETSKLGTDGGKGQGSGTVSGDGSGDSVGSDTGSETQVSLITSVLQVSTVILTTIDGKATEISTSVPVEVVMTETHNSPGGQVSPALTLMVPTLLTTVINGTTTALSTFAPFTTTIGQESGGGVNSKLLTYLVPTVISTTVDGTPTEISTYSPFTTTIASEFGVDGTSGLDTMTVEIPTLVSTTVDGTPTQISTFVPITTILGGPGVGTPQASASASSVSDIPTSTSVGVLQLEPHYKAVLSSIFLGIVLWVYL